MFNISQRVGFILKLPCCFKQNLTFPLLSLSFLQVFHGFPFLHPLICPFLSFVCAINYWEFSSVSTFNTVENKGQKRAPPKMSLQADEGKRNHKVGRVSRVTDWMVTSGLGRSVCVGEGVLKKAHSEWTGLPYSQRKELKGKVLGSGNESLMK